jgi:NADH:ubiquinone oxidoreductase subunit K
MGACAVAATTTLFLGFTFSGWSLASATEAMVVPLVVGPYVLLGLMVWWRRASRAVSGLLFIAVLVLAAVGLYLFGLDAYHHQTDPKYGMAMHFAVLGVPAVQGLAAVVLGLALLVERVVNHLRAKPGSTTGPLPTQRGDHPTPHRPR